jgi:hypothetical protein
MAGIALPAPPKSGGGHYVAVGGKPVLIKATGPGKWAPAKVQPAVPATFAGGDQAW